MGDFKLMNKKLYVLALLFLVCILSISAISATENTTNKDVINADNNKDSNLETNIQYDDVSNSEDNVELKEEENNNKDKGSEAGTDKTTDSNDELTFTDLNKIINDNTNSTIYLSDNYKYIDYLDSSYKDGINISRNLTIYGNGITIDGNKTARIFKVDENVTAEFHNINFINGEADQGGAILRGDAYNCTFKGNHAIYGGAIRYGNAYNCTFTKNIGGYDGGGILEGDAYNCTFTKNTAYWGGAIKKGNAYNCTFTENDADYDGGAMWGGSAFSCKFHKNQIYEGAGGATYETNAYYCTFTENQSPVLGGAMQYGSAFSCNFHKNKVLIDDGGAGGAISQGDAYNCTFQDNEAPDGDAMYYGRAALCSFNGDSYYHVTIIPVSINVLNYTSTYKSGERLKFNLTAEDKLLDGFNTTIEIYKDGSLVKTVYGLSGEGWIVDLIPGEYTAVLHLTDYSEEKSSNATINVKQDIPFDLTFSDLNATINGNNNSTIYLSKNCAYNETSDESFKKGILINRNLTIYGNGVTIDGMDMARIFNVENHVTVKFYNINFRNGKADQGGAIKGGDAYDCTFTENKAKEDGGAIYKGNAYNCTFQDNNAPNGRAMYEGTACLCIFNGDSTKNTEIIPAIINVLNYTSTYKSGEKLQFNLTAKDMVFDGFNITIDIYKDGQLFKTVYGLSGEGWIVDLEPIEYTAVLSITGHPDEKSSNATINVKQDIPFDLTFSDLNATINGNNNSTIYLSKNCAYNETSDESFKKGILINRNLTIYGNGVTIDGMDMARIFNVENHVTVKFYNINFRNGKADQGGAIKGGDAYDCTFTENKAKEDGGAIYKGNAYNCTFQDNNAPNGRAMYEGTACLCIFNGDSTKNTEIIPAIINVLNYTSTYKSGEKLQFNLTAKDMVFDGLNITINIYKEGQLFKTVYGLSGEGWIVDLEPGDYTAVLSITGHPGENSSNATITVRSTFTDLNSVINDNTNSTIYLPTNNYYKYDNTTDIELINGIIINRNLTIYGNGAIINAEKIARIFKVDNKVNVKFYNITFTNGKADYGGAIYGGEAYNCTFTQNTADYGGAIYQGNAYNSTFTENKAESDGGALYMANAYYCNFTGNTAKEDGGAIWGGNAYNCTFIENIANTRGGAIWGGNATDSTFTKNEANKSGGAIHRGNAINCNFTQNKANEYGGAVHFGNASGCIFTENEAGKDGGALETGNASNCQFTHNKANENGGAIGLGNTYNSTFTRNQANQDGGAIYNGNATNCIFTQNKATGDGGALDHANAYNCTFTVNTAKNGGALDHANAYNCTFAVNTAENGGAINQGNTYNSTFTQNQANQDGGAIYNGNATNCIFTQNQATENGGALDNANAYNCTFEDNIAENGEAMYKGTAWLCIYNGDSTEKTEFIPAIINVLNYTSTYKSGEKLQFNLTAKDMVFDGLNITINIYKEGQLFKTVYGLSGEGWIVDLEPGEYTAVLSITGYPDEKSVNATINVSKGNTSIVIDPIIDVVVGKEIKINYTTNSNGTVTIKVNGTPITGGKFTPTAVGTYNLTVEIAENEYYTAESNQTTFTVGKAGSKIIAKPVTAIYNVGKYLIITLKDQNDKAIKGAVLTVNLGHSKKYRTDDNGQIKINVAILTPKTYNAKITYVGSDIYKSSTSSVKVTVKKAKPKITARPARFKLKVKTKKYTAYFKDNKNKALKNTKVSLKVNGKTYTTKTNSKGQATFKITNLKKKGTYTAVITIPTNKYYNKVTKKVKITVKP